MKQNDGKPEVKQKIRQLQQQFANAKSEGMKVRCAILHENGVDLTRYLIAAAMGKGSSRQNSPEWRNLKHLGRLHQVETKGCANENGDDGTHLVLQTDSDWEQDGNWISDI